MESEKVKEIKKALEHCGEKVTCKGCPEYNNEPVIDWFKCKKNLLQKTITLINELESENERLLNQKWDKEDDLDNYHEENQQLKDRIAELEKGNEALSFAVEQGFNDCQTKTLKQFAERLKEIITQPVEMNYYKKPSKRGKVDKELLLVIIDETLKEFIK